MSEYGGHQMTTEMKFDQYFLYSIDNFGGKGNNAPPCGPHANNDYCAESSNSGETCCTHVVMWDQNKNAQNSFYRCMNYKMVDVGFSVEIDGMEMSMKCMNHHSGASYLSSITIATFLSLITLAIFI